jgi:hypothetical protein
LPRATAVAFSIVEQTANHDLAELLVAREQPIEWFELAQGIRPKRFTHVFKDKSFEPIPQSARFSRNCIQFAWNGAPPESAQCFVGYQFGLFEPHEKVFART